MRRSGVSIGFIRFEDIDMKHTSMTLAWSWVSMVCCWPVYASEPVQHALPEFVLQAPALPDARELYDRTLACWPSASHFRVELSLEHRMGSRSELPPDASPWSMYSGSSTSLVARLPLYSAIELDRARERESSRRQRAAEAVGHWLTQLADRQRIRQELDLMKTMERRARQRVLLGIVDSNEQVKYLERVADLEGHWLRHLGQIERSRLELLGFCAHDRADGLDRWLRRYMSNQEQP